MKLAITSDLLNMINHVLRTPQNFIRLIICSPFINSKIIASKLGPNETTKIQVIILTLPDTASALISYYTRIPCYMKIIPIQNLHAKIYLAIGNHVNDSFSFIGS